MARNQKTDKRTVSRLNLPAHDPVVQMTADRAGCCSRHGLDCQGPEACRECHGTRKCNCIACHGMNGENCLACSPSKKIQQWRDLPSYRDRLGPPAPKGDANNTPTDRYIAFFPR